MLVMESYLCCLTFSASVLDLEFKKEDTDELIFVTETDSQTEKLLVTKGDRLGGVEGWAGGLGCKCPKIKL